MASLFSLKIINLRKKSRVLLTSLEENAKIVNKEVRNLRKNDPSWKSYLKKYHRRFPYTTNSDIWKLRNDSSGVGAALCPNYFRFSPRYESHSEPEINMNRKMLLKSEKKYSKPSPQRRGIKECYCYTNSQSETRKINQRSIRTKRKTNVPNLSEIDTRHLADGEKIPARMNDLRDFFNHGDKNDELNNSESCYSPPISGATLIRAQKIDYTPRSRFLRKVQSKVNSLRSNSSPGSDIRLKQKSPSPSRRKLVDRNNLLETKFDDFIAKNYQQKNEYPKKHNCLCSENDHDNDHPSHYRIPKKTLLPKKTIVSQKSSNDHHKSIHNCIPAILKSPVQNKRTVRVIDKDDYTSENKIRDQNLRRQIPRDYDDNNCPCSFYKGEKFPQVNSDEEGFDFGINNVQKFREKNYFDTHASNPSLLGSRSSGSMRQFYLNERLFPEPIGRIHRDNIVLSIPPCATRQKKTIHYFPRNIIKQEKNMANINHVKKRRCPSCPLIGHAVDLGVLKVSHPSNSLALRYQKGIP